jgi:hypothetical protein
MLLSHRAKHRLPALVIAHGGRALTPEAAAVRDRRASLAAMSLPPELDDAQRQAVRAAIVDAFMVGHRAVMAIAAGLALASAVVAWLMIRPTRNGG